MNFAPQKVEMQRRADGTILLRSPQKLGPYARCVTEWLVHWSDKAPDRTFLAERVGERWKKLTYRETYGAVRRIAQALLDRGLGPERPVAILSDNGLDHALLALGAMHVGIPVAPVSPAYSLMSQDFGKLKYIFELVQPGLVESLEDLPRGAPHVKFTVEIHEGAIVNVPAIIELKAALRDRGMRIAYDDFGAGQARLLELGEAPPDLLKFDIRFIRGVDAAPPSKRRLLSSLVAIVRDLGAEPLAEGVETAEEAAACIDIGFTRAQGYFFGPPRYVDEVR